MKTEYDINKHLEDLQFRLQQPCNCAGTLHHMHCILGGKMMAMQILLLEWILEENEEYDEIVERMSR